jgi:hypothetical protein
MDVQDLEAQLDICLRSLDSADALEREIRPLEHSECEGVRLLAHRAGGRLAGVQVSLMEARDRLRTEIAALERAETSPIEDA